RIAVELGDDDVGDAVAELIEEGEAVGDGVVLVSSAVRLSDRALARRGGVPDGAPFLALEGDVIGDGDLTHLDLAANEAGAVACFASHPELASLGPAAVLLIGERQGPRRVILGRGWAVHVRSAEDVLAVTGAVLAGRLARGDDAAWPIQVHAAEI